MLRIEVRSAPALCDVAIAVYTCLRHWFGVGNAHPTLPGLATLMCALVQLVLGLHGTFAAQGTVAGIPTGVTFVVSVGGPACVGVFALVELRMLAPEGIHPTWVPQFHVGDKVVPLRDDDLVLRHHARLAREAIERAQAEGDAYHAQRAVTRLGSLHADSLRLRGPDHPQTLVARLHLAYWRGRAGDAPAAAAAFTDLVAGIVRVLGEDHQHTRAARRNLAHWTRRSASPHATR